jgi:hypothetical protein
LFSGFFDLRVDFPWFENAPNLQLVLSTLKCVPVSPDGTSPWLQSFSGRTGRLSDVCCPASRRRNSHARGEEYGAACRSWSSARKGCDEGALSGTGRGKNASYSLA